MSNPFSVISQGRIPLDDEEEERPTGGIGPKGQTALLRFRDTPARAPDPADTAPRNRYGRPIPITDVVEQPRLGAAKEAIEEQEPWEKARSAGIRRQRLLETPTDWKDYPLEAVKGAGSLVEGAGQLVDWATRGYDPIFAPSFKAVGKDIQAGASYLQSEAMQFVDKETDVFDWERPGAKIVGMVVNSIPSLLATGGIGAQVARGAAAVGGRLATIGAAGVPQAVAGRVPGMVGAGVAGAALNAGDLAGQIEQDIMAAPEATLREGSKYYNDLRAQGKSEAEARAELVREAQGWKPIAAGLVGGLSAFGIDATVANIFAGKLAATSITKGFLKGMSVEAAQEFTENAGNSYLSQKAKVEQGLQKEIDWNQVWKEGAAGALVGAIIGGGVGAYAREKPTVVPSNAQSPANTAALNATQPPPPPGQPGLPSPAPAGPASQWPPGPASQWPPGPASQYPPGPSSQYTPPGPASQYPPGPASQYPPGPTSEYPPGPASDWQPLDLPRDREFKQGLNMLLDAATGGPEGLFEGDPAMASNYPPGALAGVPIKQRKWLEHLALKAWQEAQGDVNAFRQRMAQEIQRVHDATANPELYQQQRREEQQRAQEEAEQQRMQTAQAEGQAARATKPFGPAERQAIRRGTQQVMQALEQAGVPRGVGGVQPFVEELARTSADYNAFQQGLNQLVLRFTEQQQPAQEPELQPVVSPEEEAANREQQLAYYRQRAAESPESEPPEPPMQGPQQPRAWEQPLLTGKAATAVAVAKARKGAKAYGPTAEEKAGAEEEQAEQPDRKAERAAARREKEAKRQGVPPKKEPGEPPTEGGMARIRKVMAKRDAKQARVDRAKEKQQVAGVRAGAAAPEVTGREQLQKERTNKRRERPKEEPFPKDYPTWSEERQQAYQDERKAAREAREAEERKPDVEEMKTTSERARATATMTQKDREGREDALAYYRGEPKPKREAPLPKLYGEERKPKERVPVYHETSEDEQSRAEQLAHYRGEEPPPRRVEAKGTEGWMRRAVYRALARTHGIHVDDEMAARIRQAVKGIGGKPAGERSPPIQKIIQRFVNEARKERQQAGEVSEAEAFGPARVAGPGLDISTLTLSEIEQAATESIAAREQAAREALVKPEGAAPDIGRKGQKEAREAAVEAGWNPPETWPLMVRGLISLVKYTGGKVDAAIGVQIREAFNKAWYARQGELRSDYQRMELEYDKIQQDLKDQIAELDEKVIELDKRIDELSRAEQLGYYRGEPEDKRAEYKQQRKSAALAAANAKRQIDKLEWRVRPFAPPSAAPTAQETKQLQNELERQIKVVAESITTLDLAKRTKTNKRRMARAEAYLDMLQQMLKKSRADNTNPDFRRAMHAIVFKFGAARGNWQSQKWAYDKAHRERIVKNTTDDYAQEAAQIIYESLRLPSMEQAVDHLALKLSAQFNEEFVDDGNVSAANVINAVRTVINQNGGDIATAIEGYVTEVKAEGYVGRSSQGSLPGLRSKMENDIRALLKQDAKENKAKKLDYSDNASRDAKVDGSIPPEGTPEYDSYRQRYAARQKFIKEEVIRRGGVAGERTGLHKYKSPEGIMAEGIKATWAAVTREMDYAEKNKTKPPEWAVLLKGIREKLATLGKSEEDGMVRDQLYEQVKAINVARANTMRSLEVMHGGEGAAEEVAKIRRGVQEWLAGGAYEARAPGKKRKPKTEHEKTLARLSAMRAPPSQIEGAKLKEQLKGADPVSMQIELHKGERAIVQTIFEQNPVGGQAIETERAPSSSKAFPGGVVRIPKSGRGAKTQVGAVDYEAPPALTPAQRRTAIAQIKRDAREDINLQKEKDRVAGKKKTKGQYVKDYNKRVKDLTAALDRPPTPPAKTGEISKGESNQQTFTRWRKMVEQGLAALKEAGRGNKIPDTFNPGNTIELNFLILLKKAVGAEQVDATAPTVQARVIDNVRGLEAMLRATAGRDFASELLQEEFNNAFGDVIERLRHVAPPGLEADEYQQKVEFHAQGGEAPASVEGLDHQQIVDFHAQGGVWGDWADRIRQRSVEQETLGEEVAGLPMLRGREGMTEAERDALEERNRARLQDAHAQVRNAERSAMAADELARLQGRTPTPVAFNPAAGKGGQFVFRVKRKTVLPGLGLPLSPGRTVLPMGPTPRPWGLFTGAASSLETRQQTRLTTKQIALDKEGRVRTEFIPGIDNPSHIAELQRQLAEEQARASKTAADEQRIRDYEKALRDAYNKQETERAADRAAQAKAELAKMVGGYKSDTDLMLAGVLDFDPKTAKAAPLEAGSYRADDLLNRALRQMKTLGGFFRGGVGKGLKFIRRGLANRLNQIVGNMEVEVVPYQLFHEGKRVAAQFRPSLDGRPRIEIDQEYFNTLPAAVQAHILQHEMTHGATSTAYNLNLNGAKPIFDALFAQAKRSEIGTDPRFEYAMRGPKEFIAEVRANSDLQEAMHMMNSPSPAGMPTKMTIWRRFVQAVQNVIGMAFGGKPAESYLTHVLATIENHDLTTVEQMGGDITAAMKKKMMETSLPGMASNDDPLGVDPIFKDTIDNVAAAFRARSGGFDALRRGGAWNKFMRFGLGFEGTRAMGRWAQQTKLFNRADGSNALVDMIRVFTSTGTMIQDLQAFSDRLAKETANLVKTVSEAKKGIEALYDMSLWGHDGRYDLYHRNNQHLWTAAGNINAAARQAHARNHADWMSLAPSTQNALNKVVDYYQNMQKLLAGVIAKNIVEADIASGTIATPAGVTRDTFIQYAMSGRINRPDSAKSQSELQLDAMLGDALPRLQEAMKIANTPGIYLPFMRKGDYVVRAMFKVPTPRSMAGGRYRVARKGTENVYEFSGTGAEPEARAYAEKLESLGIYNTMKIRYVDANGATVRKGTTGSLPQYVVTAQARHVEFFRTYAEAQGFADEAKTSGDFDPASVTNAELIGNRFNQMNSEIRPAHIESMYKAIEQNPHHTPSTRATLKRALDELTLSSMSGYRVQKHRLRRTNVRGYDKDMVADLFSYGASMARHITETSQAPEMARYEQEVMEMQDKHALSSDPSDALAGQRLIDETQRRLAEGNITGNEFTNKLKAWSYMHYLASTAASALNATQTWAVLAPALYGKYDANDVMKSMTQAYREIGAFASLKSAWSGTIEQMGNWTGEEDAPSPTGPMVDRVVGPEKKDLFRQAVREGVLSKHAGVEYDQFSEVGKFGKFTSWAARIATVLPQTIESINRSVSLLATYDLARKAGKDHQTAVDEAIRMTDETQVDMTRRGRGRYFNHPIWGIPLQFKQFSVAMVSIWARNIHAIVGKDATPQEKKEARRTLIALAGMTVLLSGVSGLPWDIAKAMVTAAWWLGAEDDWEDYETGFQRFLTGMMGGAGAEYLTRGIVRSIGIEVSNRIGYDSLILSQLPREKTTASFAGWIANQLAGAPGAMLGNIAVAAQAGMNGRWWDAAEKAPLPKLATDLVRSLRGFSEGRESPTGLPLQTEYTSWEAVVRALGFTPGREAASFETGSAAKYKETKKANKRLGELKNEWARAETTAEKQAAWEKIKALNEANEDTRDYTPATMGSLYKYRKGLEKRVQERREEIEEDEEEYVGG